MIVRFHTTVVDLVAFNRYHCAHSPAVKRTKFTWMALASALFLGGSLIIPSTEELSRVVIVAAAVACAVLFSVFFNYRFAASLDRQARRLYEEGTNKGMVGQHELEIDDHGLVERTAVNETRQSWHGVERITETEEHAFIYISSIMAHVIPKRSVTVGDPDTFIARARKSWLAANPDVTAGEKA